MSEAIEESGVKLVMAALALEMGGNVDASNQNHQARTDQMTYDNSNRAGERQSDFRETQARLLFRSDAPAQRGRRAHHRIFAAVCAGSITAAQPQTSSRAARHCSRYMNAFLTLTAVTEQLNSRTDFEGRPMPHCTLEIPWQLSKFHREIRICALERARLASMFGSAVWRREARQTRGI